MTIGLPCLSVGYQTLQTLLFSPEIVMAYTECLVINRTCRFFSYFTKHISSDKPRLLTGNIRYSLVSPVSLSLLQTLVIFPRSANINHQGTEISQPLSVLPHLGAWEKSHFFQNDGLTECKITPFMLLLLMLLKMR